MHCSNRNNKIYLDSSGNPVTEKVLVTLPTTLPPVIVAVTDASGNSITGFTLTNLMKK